MSLRDAANSSRRTDKTASVALISTPAYLAFAPAFFLRSAHRFFISSDSFFSRRGSIGEPI